MQFTSGVGVVIAKEELKAILTCSEEHVAIRVHNGKFLAWGTDGSNSIYNRGDAFDGAGKPFKGFYDWEISANALSALNRMMQAKEEVVLETTESGLMTRYKVRHIESSITVLEGSLDGRVSTQITLDLPNVLPDRHPDVPFASLCMDWSPVVLKRLDDVGKAVGKGALARVWIPIDRNDRTYIEIDTKKSFVDGDDPRWLVILAPIRLEPEVERARRTDGDDRQEPLDFDRAPKTVVAAVQNLRNTLREHRATMSFECDDPIETDDDLAKELKARTKVTTTSKLEDYEDAEEDESEDSEEDQEDSEIDEEADPEEADSSEKAGPHEDENGIIDL